MRITPKTIYGKLSRLVMGYLRIPASIQQVHTDLQYLNWVNDNLAQMLVADYTTEYLFENPKYHQPKKLNICERSVYSQGGEDGILEELFNRIGVSNQQFVEFGVGDGLENNTAYLLTRNWSGYWIEANSEHVERIKQSYKTEIGKRTLTLKQAVVTAENVGELLAEANLPREFDLFSIDIDSNDYWVWRAIKDYRPRVVVIEYNALYPPPVEWIRKYDPEACWDGTSYYGASLKSLELLGNEKGYRLVGCSFSGVNAFFVREDLVVDRFCEPFTAENHYEPLRLYLVSLPRKMGYRRSRG